VALLVPVHRVKEIMAVQVLLIRQVVAAAQVQ
jgi:hypothetical protein